MKLKFFLPLLPVLFLLGSCSKLSNLQVEKRKYEPGFYVHTGHAEKNQPAVAHQTAAIRGQQAIVSSSAAEKQDNPVAAAAEEKVSAGQTKAVTSRNVAQKLTHAISSASSELKHENPKTKPAVRAAQPKLEEGSVGWVILMIVLCIFFPWIAVLMKEGLTKRCVAILALWLLAVLFAFLFGGTLGLLALIATIWAFLIVFDVV